MVTYLPKNKEDLNEKREDNCTSVDSNGLTIKMDPKRRRLEDMLQDGSGQEKERLDVAMVEA